MTTASITTTPLVHPLSLESSRQVDDHYDSALLSPTDAGSARTSQPPRRERRRSPLGLDDENSITSIRAADPRRSREKKLHKSGLSGRKRTWKKLLWVKQSYPDNYTDEFTFLDHLQRNPRLQPYEFWRLVADSTVIVQHATSVAIFVCCFSGIFQERVSPITVVGWASLATVLGWVLWDFWVGQEDQCMTGEEDDDDEVEQGVSTMNRRAERSDKDVSSGPEELVNPNPNRTARAGSITKDGVQVSAEKSHKSSAQGTAVPTTELVGHPTGASTFAIPPYGHQSSSLSPRNQQRLATMKSAILIYFAVLGLSPILKSLTKSTSSDSIWAISSWLLGMNVVFFDYGGGVGAKFPASLSTNAALMASTVLASRLKSTTHVFSLTLFSIEVFGLFPVFRRHLRHVSWQAHVALTALLVIGASGGLTVIISGGAWKAAIIGSILGSFLAILAMGICSWWLIDLQKYKNDIHGPWDPARPVIRRRWD